MDGVVEIITVVSTVSARNVYVDAQVPLFFLEVGEKFPQVLDACSGEGRDGIVVVDIEDCEAAVLRLHAGATPDDRQCEPVRRRARRADRCR
jgi:hypothetical protein